MKKIHRDFCLAACLLAAFALWTAALRVVDVQAIGPQGTQVGFAELNRFFHRLTGVHMGLYLITDWLGLVPVAVCVGFAALGLAQWIARKKLRRVDADLLLLGGFYLVTIAGYILFEELAVNYRPILINGFLETSYPSSTTLLVLCVMPTARLQLRGRISKRWLCIGVCLLLDSFTAFTVVGRLISGVHWLSDIIGGILLSAGLVLLYAATAGALCRKKHQQVFR